ncbi:MAG: DUF2442 domain-containing protein [Desulfuromonadales bacterium]|nr:DUF2442 domain-containing protein [Desulfuromonadales bacterium]
MKKLHEVDHVIVTDDSLNLRIDGQDYRFALAEVSPRLLAATAADRANFEISPAGYGIHWPTIDEDLSIDGLLGIRHKPPFHGQQAAI